MIFDNVLKNIEGGLSGRNIGLPNGLERINRYINNVQKGTYYLIGGEPGTGKSALTDHMFVYSPFDYLLTKSSRQGLKILYFSLEMSKEIKITKAAARKLYLDKNVLVDVNYLLSRGHNKISKEVHKMIENQKDYFDRLEGSLIIKDNSYTPADIKNELTDFSRKNGRWSEDEKTGTLNYTPYRDEYTIVVIDHIGLIKPTVDKYAA